MFPFTTVNAVEFQGVSKSYAIYDSPGDRLKELLSLNRLKRHQDFWALHDVSFEVRRGETFCIVGENGSGKSTLLQMVAGILHPSSGTVKVNGRVSALLELGAGFNPEFSGRDNVYLNGSIMGLSTRQIDQRYDDITGFAEIGDFIDQPVKTYSSGMVVRLAFAVAINVDPEILLVDEALAVGDIYFRQRCMRKVHELRQRGVTILFVSHAVSDVKAIGDRALWLDHGRMIDIGDPDKVVAKYLAAMTEKDSTYLLRKSAAEPHAHRRESRARAGNRGDHPQHRPPLRRRPRRGDRHRRLRRAGPRRSTCWSPPRASWCASASAPRPMCRCRSWASCCATSSAWISPAPTPRAKATSCRPCRRAISITVDFHVELPELYPASFSFSPADRRRHADGLHHVRLDRQRRGAADGPRRAADLWIHAPALPRGGERAPGARQSRRVAKQYRSGTLAEFTGERLIPGQVDVDLLNEHMARYTFAVAPGARQARAGRRLRRRLRLGRTGRGWPSASPASTSPPRPSNTRAPTTPADNITFEAGQRHRACPTRTPASTWWWPSK